MKPFVAITGKDSRRSSLAARPADATSALEQLPGAVLTRIYSELDRPSLNSLSLASSFFSESISPLELLDLPTELLLAIFKLLDRQSLSRAARASKRCRDLAYADNLWLQSARGLLATGTFTESIPRARDRVRISRNWRRGEYREATLLAQSVRYMPCLQLESRKGGASELTRVKNFRRMK